MEEVPLPSGYETPEKAVGDKPDNVLKCTRCGRIWAQYRVKGLYGKFQQRWFIVNKGDFPRAKPQSGARRKPRLPG